MPDRLTVLRRSGSALDDTTLIETPAFTTVASDVPCIVAMSRDEGDREQGGQPLSATTFRVHVPASYTDWKDGDALEVTTSGDPLTLLLYVENVNSGTTTVTRTLICRTFGSGLNDGDWPEAAS